uniref:Protein kinase domain-containing protein n=1 Tax=Amorphochlora amoebiformis TaxID=1561963 RepID=A0A7S0H0G8_9EUKA|mmetsp:Transcript_22383/g.35151  ORF Transcript_22383/g.35151 Transcript_22383/m.35151 type:complete len:818 (+) Transcript_22383:598-3051(+)
MCFTEADIKRQNKLTSGNFGEKFLVTLKTSNKKAVLWTPKSRESGSELKKSLIKSLHASPQPNILEYIGVFYDAKESESYLTEYCGLGSIEELHTTRDLTKPGNFWKIATGLFVGLAHLSKNNIIHRNICCQNLLVTTDWEIKITGFNLSVRAPRNFHDASRGVLLPWPWLPPETLKTGRFTPRSDTWAAGVSLWEVLHRGKKPYSGSDGKLPSFEQTIPDIINNKSILEVPGRFRHTPMGWLVRACLRAQVDIRPSALEALILWMPNGFGEKAIDKSGTPEVKADAKARMREFKEVLEPLRTLTRREKISEITEVAHSLQVFDNCSHREKKSKVDFGLGSPRGLMLINMLMDVRTFRWRKNSKTTTIPDQLMALTEIDQLDLSNNGVRHVPEGIKTFKNLETLLLDGSSVELPKELKYLSKLKTLLVCLGDGDHEDLQPVVTSLVRLETLIITSASRGVKTIPGTIKNLANMRTLHIESRQLTRLPVEITELVNLVTLRLHCDKLRELPTDIQKLSNLITFDLMGCRALESLPSGCLRLSEMRKLVLKDCTSLASLPEGFKRLNLQELNLSYVRVNAIPLSDIGSMSNLTKLSIAGVECTFLPDDFPDLIRLEELDLSDRQDKYFPVFINNLSRLRSLRLSGNTLKKYPPITGVLGLRKLDLSDNYLKFIGSEIKSLGELQILNLSRNLLQARSFPLEMRVLVHLEELDLSHNGNLKTLPDRLRCLVKLRKLILNDCAIATVPFVVTTMFTLEFLDLRNNVELKAVPNELKNLLRLKRLDLPLMCSVPEEVQSLEHLTVDFFPLEASSDRDEKRSA